MFHLIDCDFDLLKVSGELLAATGFDVRAFNSPVAYLEYLQRPDFVPPIVIITCYKMAKMSGYELISEVRKTYPMQKAVIISGSPEFDITPSMDHLVCRHLPKPTAFPELIRTLKILNLCDDSCPEINGNIFEPSCKFGIQHDCPLYVATDKLHS